jgi:hypothetical protein
LREVSDIPQTLSWCLSRSSGGYRAMLMGGNNRCYLQTRSYKRGKASPWTPTGLWVYTQGHYNYMGEMDKNIFW